MVQRLRNTACEIVLFVGNWPIAVSIRMCDVHRLSTPCIFIRGLIFGVVRIAVQEMPGTGHNSSGVAIFVSIWSIAAPIRMCRVYCLFSPCIFIRGLIFIVVGMSTKKIAGTDDREVPGCFGGLN
jgi:hypothetical protein